MKRIGVVGFGNISRRHRLNLKTIYPHTEIVGVPASRRPAPDYLEFCDRTVDSISRLIAQDIEMAIVASPASLHKVHSIPLIEAGVPVLIEKPVTNNINDIQNIVDVARKTKTPVYVAYCLRFMPATERIKILLEQQRVGKIINVFIEVGQYLPDWRPGVDYRDTVSAQSALGGGALLELSHEIDYASWLFGPLNVQSGIIRKSGMLDIDTEDLTDILCVNEASSVICIHLDFLQNVPSRCCRIVGTEGTMIWDLIANSIELVSKELRKTLYSDAGWDRNEMYINMVKAFVSAIDGNKTQLATLEESRKVIELIENMRGISMYRSDFL